MLRVRGHVYVCGVCRSRIPRKARTAGSRWWLIARTVGGGRRCVLCGLCGVRYGRYKDMVTTVYGGDMDAYGGWVYDEKHTGNTKEFYAKMVKAAFELRHDLVAKLAAVEAAKPAPEPEDDYGMY